MTCYAVVKVGQALILMLRTGQTGSPTHVRFILVSVTSATWTQSD